MPAVRGVHFQPISYFGRYPDAPGDDQRDGESCCCTPLSAAEGAERARNFVTAKWIAADDVIPLSSNGPSLGGWDVVLERARTHALSVSGMAFQDAWTLDLERLRDCCIHIVSPDGRIIPFCAYNLTDRHGRALYRGRHESDSTRTLDRP